MVPAPRKITTTKTPPIRTFGGVCVKFSCEVSLTREAEPLVAAARSNTAIDGRRRLPEGRREETPSSPKQQKKMEKHWLPEKGRLGSTPGSIISRAAVVSRRIWLMMSWNNGDGKAAETAAAAASQGGATERAGERKKASRPSIRPMIKHSSPTQRFDKDHGDND